MKCRLSAIKHDGTLLRLSYEVLFSSALPCYRQAGLKP